LEFEDIDESVELIGDMEPKILKAKVLKDKKL